MAERPLTIRDPKTGRHVLMTVRENWGRRYYSADGHVLHRRIRAALADGGARDVLLAVSV